MLQHRKLKRKMEFWCLKEEKERRRKKLRKIEWTEFCNCTLCSGQILWCTILTIVCGAPINKKRVHRRILANHYHLLDLDILNGGDQNWGLMVSYCGHAPAGDCSSAATLAKSVNSGDRMTITVVRGIRGARSAGTTWMFLYCY